MDKKMTLAVVFGGQSSEHEISCISAPNVIDQIDRDKYDLLLLGITEEGHWLKAESAEEIRSGKWKESNVEAIISPDASLHGVIFREDGKVSTRYVDAAFPVMHGLWGEDGTLQGIFELAGIPYVGCGVLASAVSMDKVYTKIIVDALGIRQAAYVLVFGSETKEEKLLEKAMDRVEEKLPYPVFVKPSCSGSSRGVHQAKNRQQLAAALQDAALHDEKILVEETIVGREIECAVLGYGENTRASGVGEVLAAAEFYDFDAKYHNAQSRTVLDPELPYGAKERVMASAARIFNGLDGFGLSRVDFFVKEDGTVIFNEINTLPGFTAISMYPMLWANRGIEKKELVQRLIDLAFERRNAYAAYRENGLKAEQGR